MRWKEDLYREVFPEVKRTVVEVKDYEEQVVKDEEVEPEVPDKKEEVVIDPEAEGEVSE